MAGLRAGSIGEDVVDGVVATPAIKVNQACQLFGARGDEVLAQNLQDKEYEMKYSWNREVRQTARKDVPLAKATHDEEEEQLQRERLHFLQNQTRLAEEDAELARQYDREEQLAKQRDKVRQEILDQEMAKRIQVMEIQEQGRPNVKRSRDDTDSERGVIRMSSFPGFHLDTSTAAGGSELTEEERKQLMMMQDEELALALQEHEQLKALRLERGHAVARSFAEGHVTTQQFVPVVIPVQQDVLISRGPAQVVGPSQHVTFQHQPRSFGPPTHRAPQAQVHHVRADDGYLIPHRTSKPNDASGRSVTLVTSVGKSEFFRTLPAAETRSAEPKSRGVFAADRKFRGNSPAQTNRKPSSQDAGRKTGVNNNGKRK